MPPPEKKTETEGKEPDYMSAEPEGDEQQDKDLNQQGEDVDPAHNCNVYIAGIPKRATEDTLRKVFSKFGSIQ